ncbi:hypothetical protein SUGI_1045520 [Cryptomeria japonica]|uniref:phospholipase A I isoform X2 n=1 Tax=Cryptomeria japonica TaxID=3369 RepID=UPI002414AB11|nr:phospholipase A I isoform X2 [Cryptomeria japonica]GLJ49400.1 hypothetical protein SUGI_1045520 [Cryptomeria japonica]
MAWGLGSWKRPADSFRLTLGYGYAEEKSYHSALSLSDPTSECKFKIELDWSAADEEEQVALKLQSQLMVTLPPPQDQVQVEMSEENGDLKVAFKVVKKREALRVASLSKTLGSGQQSDGVGVIIRMLRSSATMAEELLGYTNHWKTITLLNLSACSLTVLPVELIRLPYLERLHLDNNKLSLLPPELGELKCLKVLRVDHNMLVSVPVELRQCVGLIELSLEHNKLVRPLLDFRAMSELRVLRLFGNPLEFLPEILPLSNLRHLSLANVRIEGNENLSTVAVDIETENSSYFVASRHKLSAFFSLVFRFSSCQHPLLASALAKITEDNNNRNAIGRDENAVRQLISMLNSDNRHVVEQACSALSSLASDTSLAILLMKADIMQPIESVLKSIVFEELISVLHVVVNMAFASDVVASKMLTKEVVKSLKLLCAHENIEVQRLALLAVGNLAFCWENRRTLVASESLRELLIRLTVGPTSCVTKAAARALAILGENEYLRRTIRGRPVGKQGLRVLSMDGGGMRGLATVQMLRRIEQGTGKRINEIFDLICGTSTGGMLAIALGIKGLSLDQCEEIYKTLGKLVFAEPITKDNEAATWREKLDQLYKSSSQNFRVVVHGSKHNADQFERLLKEMCADEDGDLLIDSAVRNIPKVFVVSTLVSVIPAQPFVFRNYQYPPGTPETTPWTTEGPTASVSGTPATAAPLATQIGQRRSAFIGSCKHHVWEAIRASSAAPYYLDDFAEDVNRWQDGAIVANNPTLIAIREAQLLWPDTRIGCLISLGCGNLPTKPRGKGGWRYLDTGQVLIESACSVERVEETLDTLLPMIPDIQYFRFNPVDERCGMELDETDPAVWVKLEAATQEFVEANNIAFQAACERLLPPHHDEEAWSDITKSYHFLSKTKTLGSVHDEAGPCLGWRRRILLAESSQSLDLPSSINHVRSLQTYCSQHGIKLELLNRLSGTSRSAAPASTPYTSPMFTGSFPTSPLLYSPEVGLQQLNHLDLVPPLSLDGGQNQVFSGKVSFSPPRSPPLGPRQLSGPVQALQEKLQNSPQVGIVHFALQCDSLGLILSWRNDVFVVAEPGALADAFLQGVRASLFLGVGQKFKKCSTMPKISTISGLVARYPRFQLGGVLHRFMGRQTQVMADDQEIAAYMFQRMLPAIHLTPEDVRWMGGVWRERIMICTGKCGPSAALVKAFLDSGAKAIIAPSVDPPELQQNVSLDSLAGSRDSSKPDSGRFVIGEDDEDEGERSGPSSDWEDSDFEECEDKMEKQHEEKDLCGFVCTLYDNLFREGVRADIALQNALDVHPKQHYRCHLPKI